MGAKRHKKQNKSSQKPPHLRCRTAVSFTHPRVKQRSSHRCCGAWVIHPAIPDSSYRTFGCYRGHLFLYLFSGTHLSFLQMATPRDDLSPSLFAYLTTGEGSSPCLYLRTTGFCCLLHFKFLVFFFC